MQASLFVEPSSDFFRLYPALCLLLPKASTFTVAVFLWRFVAVSMYAVSCITFSLALIYFCRALFAEVCALQCCAFTSNIFGIVIVQCCAGGSARDSNGQRSRAAKTSTRSRSCRRIIARSRAASKVQHDWCRGQGNDGDRIRRPSLLNVVQLGVRLLCSFLRIGECASYNVYIGNAAY